MMRLSNVLESILFVSGKEIEIKEICEKLQIELEDLEEAIAELEAKLGGESGIVILRFNDKLQLSSNSAYVDEVSAVLNPIREKELTKAMLETLAIIAYKQPVTRLDVEEVRGVDCSYAIQTLSKLQMIRVLGRKDAVGKPLLFGTTDEFLKRFQLSDIDELPDHDSLLERIEVLSNADLISDNSDFYNSNRSNDAQVHTNADVSEKEDMPDFLQGEQVEVFEGNK